MINSACPDAIIDEAKFIRKYIDELTGGSPDHARDKYLEYSAFIASDSLGGKAKFFKAVPMRLYAEPDLKTLKTKYCEELTYQNLNSADLDGLNKLLTKLGNKTVEYIKTTDRGMHSWNIADPEELAVWAEKQF